MTAEGNTKCRTLGKGASQLPKNWGGFVPGTTAPRCVSVLVVTTLSMGSMHPSWYMMSLPSFMLWPPDLHPCNPLANSC